MESTGRTTVNAEKTSQMASLKTILDSRGILSVILNRPQVRNAFNDEMIEDLTQVFSTNVMQSDVRIVILRGEGSSFCAGGDLNWMKRSIELNYEENLQDTRKLTRMFERMNQCPKPVVGVIHGAAIGGGVGLVSICDIALAVADTQFSLSEVRLGIVPACIGPFVIAKIGSSHARHLFISAQRFLADKAQKIGLIHEVHPNMEVLEESLKRTVDSILQCGPQALTVAKQLVLDLSLNLLGPERRAQNNDCLEYVAEVLARLRVSEEGQEGLKAFLEKRHPKWPKMV